MALDVFYLGALNHELNNKLIQSRITKIYQPDRYSISLAFYHNQTGEGRLFISAHPLNARIQITKNIKENPKTPPLFCMVLRKHLEKARIKAIRQKDLERIIEIDFNGYNDWGEETNLRMVIEIMGKHSNIILLNHENIILDGIRRYSHAVSRHREVLPGRPYIAPPAQNKQTLSDYDEEKLANLLYSQGLSMKIKDFLLREAAGFSPLMAEEAIERASLDKNTVIEEIGDYEIQRLLGALNELYGIYNDKKYAPVILGGEKARDFAAFPLKIWQNDTQINYTSPSLALDDYFLFKEVNELFSSRQRELLKTVNQNYQRLEKKIKLQEEDLKKAGKYEFYKEAADLLSANLYHLQKGQEITRLESFFRPGEQLEIKLDPALSPEDNMKNYYRRYSKNKSARALIKNQLDANISEFAYIDSLMVSLNNASEPKELEEIRKELTQEGYLKEKKPDKNKKPNRELPLSPRTFVSKDGYTILVGRNNRQNDTLTLRTANKDDIWLHTQKIPGSHVIIRNRDRFISDQAIEEAAEIAAWYSKAQSADKVPVDYTTVDQVKKPNGAKPGMVIYFQQKTLYVKPKEPV